MKRKSREKIDRRKVHFEQVQGTGTVCNQPTSGRLTTTQKELTTCERCQVTRAFIHNEHAFNARHMMPKTENANVGNTQDNG